MVTYELKPREDDVLIFRYWPEDDRQSKPGQFAIDLANETANLVEPAEREFRCRTTGAEMNSMRDAINDMRAERGELPLTEEELPTEPDDLVSEWWNYYDHALRDLSRKRDAGVVPDRGAAMWY